MERRRTVMRFQEGIRTRHPAPEAILEASPPGTPVPAGEALAVLVDLTPSLPHRSRELRVIAAETYWASEGSVVARLRRALAKANRYLSRANAQSGPTQKTTGSITCVAFFEEELFLGQVGPGHAMLYQPGHDLEHFPQDEDPLLPLGVTLPPVIHISYADVGPGSKLWLMSTAIADAVEPSNWSALLSKRDPGSAAQAFESLIETRGRTGSCILVQYVSAPKEKASTPKRPFQLPRLKSTRKGPTTSEQASFEEAPSEEQPSEKLRPPKKETPSQAQRAKLVPQKPLQAPRPAQPEGEHDEKPRPKRRSLTLPKLRLPRIKLRTQPRAQKLRAKRAWKLPNIRIKTLLKPLLPGKVGKRAPTRPRRRVPEEKSTVMSGLTLGFLLIVLLITVTTYFQPRDEALRQQADEAWRTALETQDLDDWERLARLSDQMLALDPQNTEAQMLRDTAQKAIDAADDATILNATPIMELGTSPSPRRIIVADSWVYVLNPATDEVRGLPLEEDGIIPATGMPTPILKNGQTVPGSPEPVGSLVDIAWMTPGPGYPDGAVLIYSENGYLYIYEPHIGPSNIDHQRLEGDIHPGAITLVETYADQFYALDRQANQVWKYGPVNGTYDAPPRAYFAPNSAPQLQTALAMGLDGQLYLLLGDGAIHTYFRGTEDISFQIEGIPITDFHPTVMTIEPDPDEGRIYLGDPKQKALVVLNKRGQYQRQFRLADETLEKLEALSVSEDPHVLYFVAANRLHAAPIPASVNP